MPTHAHDALGWVGGGGGGGKRAASSTAHSLALLPPSLLLAVGRHLLRNREEGVRLRGNFHGLDAHPQIAGGPILEADRHRESRGQFPMDLALDGAGPYGPPTDEIGDELRGHCVKELNGSGKPQFIDINKQLPPDAEALVDGK